MALRGVECAPCRRVGHGCPAVANDGEPKCLDCMNEQPCAAVRCAGQVREESGVRAEYRGWGEVAFPDGQGEVRQRTPEELGLAREIEYAPVQPTWMKPFTEEDGAKLTRRIERSRLSQPRVMVFTTPSAPHRSRLEEAFVRGAEPVARLIEGVEVKMPAAATMGAEPLDGFIAERKEEVRRMPSWNRVSEETKAKIAADAKTMTYAQLEAKYGLSHLTIYRTLKQRGVSPLLPPNAAKSTAVLRAKSRKGGHACAAEGCDQLAYGEREYCSAMHAWKNSRPPATKRKEAQAKKLAAAVSGVQLVKVDPQANGSAASLLSAIEKLSSFKQPEKVIYSMLLTKEDVNTIISGLSEEQEAKFVTAGLRAVLLG